MRRILWTALAASILAIAPLAAKADDQAIAAQVAENFKGNLHAYSVEVKVQDGTAWLNGVVADPQQMSTAISIAKHTPGVKQAVNNLAIGSAGAAADGSQRTPAPRQRGVMQAPMELPEHARQELAMGNSMTDDDGYGGDSSFNRTASAESYPNSNNVRRAGGNFGGNGNVPNTMRPMGQPMPLPINGGSPYRQAGMQMSEGIGAPPPLPDGSQMGPGGPAPYRYDHAQMPGYAWPSYAASPNYAAVTYPKQYSPTAWPYIGPFYPYPQVPLGWRKVALEWKDGWWFLDFQDSCH